LVELGGKLLTDVKDIGGPRLRHFQRLAAGTPQRGRERWQRFTEDLGVPRTGELGGDFTAKELYEAVRKLKHHKAPGEGNVAAERTRKLLPTDPNENGGYPSTVAQVVWRLLNAVRREGHVPLRWSKTSLVSALKKGGPLEVDNCRGVSLLPTPFKVLPTAVTTRVEKCLEKRGTLAREQAGFRRAEECVS